MTKLSLSVCGLLSIALIACAAPNQTTQQKTEASAKANYTENAVFAGGCFWCVESDFEKLDGVGDVISGYSSGPTTNPTYKTHVSEGHREVARVPYDPDVISYAELVDFFLRHVDVTDAGGQFCDRGHSYTTAIFVETAAERQIATNAIKAAEAEIGQKIVTPVLDEAPFYAAEGYHQDYYKKNPVRYRYYRNGCGRDRRVKEVWGD